MQRLVCLGIVAVALVLAPTVAAHPTYGGIYVCWDENGPSVEEHPCSLDVDPVTPGDPPVDIRQLRPN